MPPKRGIQVIDDDELTNESPAVSNLPFATSHTDGCTVSRHVTTRDIERQSHRCNVCRVIWQGAVAIADSYHPYPNRKNNMEFHKRYARFIFSERAPEDEGPLRVNLEPTRELGYGGHVRIVKLQYYCAPGADLPWSEIGMSEHIGPTGLSKSTIGLAKRLINDCVHGEGKHTECRPFNEQHTRLPARVLDVGQGPDSKVKLHIPLDHETGRYVALSHCWGESVPAKTTTVNVTQHIEKGISRLPRTFLDAIFTTRALGLQYLWIDSLCIVQDSPEDWATHAPKMATVYGNAYVTISADAAQNSSHGFLENDRRALYPAKSIFAKHGGKTHVIFVRERGALAYQLPYHDWTPPDPSAYETGEYSDLHIGHGSNWLHRKDSPPMSRLSTRGWVLQERVLSPRTLHFGGAELGWECRSIITCECSATSKRHRRGSSLLKEAIFSMSWTTVVEEYTRMNLTFETDRLVALSGLAEYRHLQKSLPEKTSAPASPGLADPKSKTYRADEGPDDYIAGMWTKDLQQQLLWRPVSTSRRIYIAPTWSWASVGAAVSYRKDGKRGTQFEVFEISRLASSTGIYGNCAIGSYILMRGTIIPVSYDGRVITPRDFSGTLSYRLVVFSDVSKQDEPLQVPDLSFTTDGFFLLITSSNPAPPEGLVLIGACEDSNTEGADMKIYQRKGIASARQLVKYESWSDSDTSEEEISPSSNKVSDWKWDIWETHGQVETFRLY